MRIAINGRSFLKKNMTGIGRYAFNLVRSLGEMDRTMNTGFTSGKESWISGGGRRGSRLKILRSRPTISTAERGRSCAERIFTIPRALILSILRKGKSLSRFMT